MPNQLGLDNADGQIVEYQCCVDHGRLEISPNFHAFYRGELIVFSTLSSPCWLGSRTLMALPGHRDMNRRIPYTDRNLKDEGL